MINRSTWIVASIVLIGVSDGAMAQPLELRTEKLGVVMNQVRQRQPMTVRSDDIVTGATAAVVEALGGYRLDDSVDVRTRSVALLGMIGRESSNGRIRSAASHQLALAIADSDAPLAKRAAECLLKIAPADFSALSRRDIARAFDEGLKSPAIVRLVGWLGMANRMNDLGELVDSGPAPASAQSGRWFGKVAWSARLARARLGSAIDLQKCIERFEAERDEVAKITVLTADLVYVARDGAFEAIKDVVRANGRLPAACKGGPGTAHAQYALHYLAEGLSEFPVPIKFIGGYTEGDRIAALNWLRRQGQ